MIVPLNAGKNAIQFFTVTNQGVSRLDTMVITPIGSTLYSDAPTPPGGLGASAGLKRVNLSWAHSSRPSDCAVRCYDVYRSTRPGFMPSAGNRIATGVQNQSYSDITASCVTTYFYLIQAVDTAGGSVSAMALANRGGAWRPS